MLVIICIVVFTKSEANFLLEGVNFGKADEKNSAIVSSMVKGPFDEIIALLQYWRFCLLCYMHVIGTMISELNVDKCYSSI